MDDAKKRPVGRPSEYRDEFTADEIGALNALAAVWNAYLALPVEHPDDQAEFRALVHAAQDKIAARPGYRYLRACAANG